MGINHYSQHKKTTLVLKK